MAQAPMRDATNKMTDRYEKAGLVGLCLMLVLFMSALSASAQPIQLEVAAASHAFDQRTSEPVVTLRLTPASAKVFAGLRARTLAGRWRSSLTGA